MLDGKSNRARRDWIRRREVRPCFHLRKRCQATGVMGQCQEKYEWCHNAIEMSALNAIEMSAFLWAIEQSFLPWARRTSGYRQRGKRTDRNESSRAGSVEGLVRCNPEGAVAEGGGSVVAAHDASSAPAG